MNITFTNYAEKKAKQFLNLLQGYAKGIRFTAILILLLMGVSNMSAANITSDGTARLYFNMSAINWWTAGTNGNGNFGYFFNNSTGKNAWSAHSVKYDGNTYYVVIPKGTWAGVILTRNNTSTSPSWNNKWNQTGDITLSSTSNYISKFSEGSTSVTWGTAIKPASTGSLSASSTNINIGANVTLTPSLTSNQTINDIKSTSYSISPNSGASISTNTFTATKAGTYTITATITYHPDGYSDTKLQTTATATATITVNPWTITWNPNGGSVTPTSSTYDGATAVSLPTPTRTGYNFDGWYTAASGGTKINDIGTTTKPTNNVTYYAHWTPKNYTITLDANGGASDGSATATYNNNTVTIASHPTRTDYRCNGYYTAASDGNLVLNIDGTLAKNVSGYTNTDGNWTKDDNATLYAQWTHDVTEYTVTFGVETGSTSYGSLNAYNNTTSASITSPTQVRSGQSITFTATPETGYLVEGWYTDAACTAGKHDAGSTAYTTSIIGETNVYVKFVEKNWSVAFEAGIGGSITTPSSTPQAVGQLTGIDIAATPATGYTFKQWDITNGSGSFTSAATTNNNHFKPTADSKVTASFTETMSTLTTSNKYDAGDPGYEVPSATVSQIGIATTATITAVTPDDKYTFIGWELTHCTRTDGGADNALSITVRSTNGDGADAKVTAKYEQIPMVTLYLKPNSNWKADNARFAAYAFGNGEKWIDMIELGCTGIYTCDIPKTYTSVIFCRMNPNNSINNWDGSNKWNQTSDLTIPTDGNNLYTVKEGTWDKGGGSWSTYAATCEIITNAGEGGTITVSPSSPVDINTDVTITIVPDEGYAFASGDITIGTQTQETITETTSNATICGPTTINATFSRIQYNVNYGICSDTQWGSIALNSGSAITTTSSTTLDYGTQVILEATPNTGYHIEGWYKDNACSQSLNNGTNNFYTINSLTEAANVYVKFAENTYTVTITNGGNGGTTPNGAQTVGQVTGIDINATPNKDYGFVNWDITEGTGTFASDKTDAENKFYPTSNATIQANFHSTLTYALTVIAGEHIASVKGSTDPITLGESYNISAIPVTGYTFKSWSALPAENASFGNASEAATSVTITNGSVTVTATAVETMSTLTTSNSYTAGDPGYAIPTKSVDEIGIATTASITAAESEAGYRFAGWTLTNCVRTDGGEANAVTITVCSHGDGEEANVTANYELLPPTTIYFKPIDAWKGKDIRFAVYGWHNSTFAWIDMTSVDCNGDYYKAEIPAIYTQMKFVSFPTDKANSWENDINKTGDLTIPEAVDDKVLYDMASTNITHLYLKPNSNWILSNAWFAAYLCNGSDAASWYQLGKVEDNIYGVEIGSDKLNSTKNKNVIFCRMNPSNNNLNWSQKWDQTNDLDMPINGTNLYTIKAGAWSNGDGTWSTYYDDSKWTTYTAPTYDVTINIVGEGTIDINGTAYAESTTISAIEFNNQLSIGDISCDASNWRFASAIIKIGNNVEENITSNSQTAPICGPTTITVTFEANVLEVSFDLQGKSHDLIESQHVEREGLAVEPKANDIEGYLFGGWYKEAACKNKFDFSQPITENTTIYAKWISHNDCIFFKNNLKWANVYIYTFTENAWWNDGNEPGVHPKTNKKEHGKMIQVGQSDIYYYVLTKGNDFSYIAFSSANMSNNDAFYTNAGIYRGDHDVDMTLFIPDAKQTAETHNKTKYYNKGVWMKYNSEKSGYKLNIVNGAQVEFTTDKVGGYVFTATMVLSGKPNMDITNLQNQKKFANSGTMNQKNCTNWQMSEWTWTDQSTWYVQTTSEGDYVFTLDLSDGQVRVSVQYPLAVGDYRLAYQENDGAKNTKFHPAQYIRKVTEDTKLDIVSFFVNKAGQSPSIVLQQCTSVSNTGVGTWSTIATATTPIDLSKIERSGVYNVALQQTNAGSHQATILCNDETYPQAYTGNYYIRADAANGGWKNYQKETNQMEYTNLNADYDYYYCKWFNNPTGNVRFVVANDYSECVSDTMTTDAFLGGEKLLGESANVRFAWSSKTNTTSRAYLAGSGSNTEYLTISGTNIYTNAASPEQISGKRKFIDQNDWVYALDIKAKHGAVIDVKAVYKGKESTFIDDKNIMSTKDGDANYYTLRVIYNFKTNNIVSSWLLQDVQQDMALSADIMMIRNGQNAPNQLTLNGHSISGDPKTVYGVMQFNKADITDNTKSIEERGLYWISFPFDVNLVDVFGLGEYGTAWIIQYYDGEERAQKGWFQETATFWKYVMPEDRKNFVLKKNIGYGLALDIEAIDWPNDITQQNLYFPSAEKISTIDSELTSTIVDVPAHTCTIERDDRKTKDSHWNVIGVPSFANAEYILSQEGLKYLYEWNSTNNTLIASQATTYTFKAMHSYMVQFAGKIDWDWENKKIPQALAAKAPAKESTLLQLTLTESGKQLDQTYVELTDEATADFDMNMDLTKFFNTGHANIYSCIQTVPVAANMLPVQSVQVPLGIQVVKEGSYTIALPASVDAALVTLIDNQTQTHTCLNTSDYTVTLPAGTYENRFFLAVEPQRVVTSNPTNEQDTAPTVKFIKDGQLYILHQGVIYDAQGRR